jgi:uncharacterized membrane protein
MKSFSRFLRATLTGGVLFLLPIVLLTLIIGKAFSFMKKITDPLGEKLPDIIFGLDGRALLALFFLIAVCFFSGLLFQSKKAKNLIGGLETNVLSYVPGYSMIKSLASDAVGEKSESNLATVLVKDGDSWNIGFLVEEIGDLCTVFFPEAPRHDSGEVKIVPTASVKKLNITSNVAVKSLNSFGKGAINWIKAPDNGA